ncbi:hypothetical protein OFC37_29610, partial [Escherichia coli]|nr:hypothetical protein [Escherichia coli]
MPDKYLMSQYSRDVLFFERTGMRALYPVTIFWRPHVDSPVETKAVSWVTAWNKTVLSTSMDKGAFRWRRSLARYVENESTRFAACG